MCVHSLTRSHPFNPPSARPPHPAAKPRQMLKIVHVAVEMAPIAKVWAETVCVVCVCVGGGGVECRTSCLSTHVQHT